MSRSLALSVLALASLVGCAITPPTSVVEKPTTEIIAYSALQQWLSLQEEVASMSAEKLVAERVHMNEPQNAGELFYFALLNQKLQTYGAWTQARDAFRKLHGDEALTIEQRQLAGILLQYNQNRINWYSRQGELLKRHAELQQQMRDTEQEKLLLEQKIQALTDLEQAISTRRD